MIEVINIFHFTGHSSVKSLSSKFQPQTNGSPGNGGHSNGNGLHHHHEPQDAEQIIQEQRRMIENLKAQVTTKERRIQQLEDQVKLLTLPQKIMCKNEC